MVAPPPRIKLEVPTPVVAAPIAGQGNAASAGSADVPWPGTGAGGEGTGTGSGAFGNGTGGGGGGGGGIRARWVKGRIRNDDYPRSAFEQGAQGTVYLRFTVLPNGYVSDCRVTRSSGNAALDSTTCQLIERRFRYRPARDAMGRPVPEVIRGEHQWDLGPERPPIEIEPDIPDDEY